CLANSLISAVVAPGIMTTQEGAGFSVIAAAIAASAPREAPARQTVLRRRRASAWRRPSRPGRGGMTLLRQSSPSLRSRGCRTPAHAHRAGQGTLRREATGRGRRQLDEPKRHPSRSLCTVEGHAVAGLCRLDGSPGESARSSLTLDSGAAERLYPIESRPDAAHRTGH